MADRICSFQGCEKPVRAKGLCGTHHSQQLRGKPLTPIGRQPCSLDFCDRPSEAKGLCGAHYRAVKRGRALRPLPPLRPRPTCDVADCQRPRQSKGLCGTHYRAAREGRHLSKLDQPLESMFFDTVSEDGYCWAWTGPKNPEGYGIFWRSGTQTLAHRWVYEFLRAAIPEGLVIDHLCRNPSCVNPWHLEPVTHEVNTQRGHAARLKGEIFLPA